ncbi:hypothetical protein [Nocardiopsis sp. Huas11]|uniref:hypothetical protein n=1 Tax=Nocardiopsis sp. Huas11 TaxID=2183912 RepID=UPI001F3B9AFE|nr:hypothetical protein [Nocardiopsis sp. Huas11]
MDTTRAFYRVGFHPWEDLAEHAPFAASLALLLDREEQGREAPYGRALDLGCGSAVWGWSSPGAGGGSQGSTSSKGRCAGHASGSPRPGSTCAWSTVT